MRVKDARQTFLGYWFVSSFGRQASRYTARDSSAVTSTTSTTRWRVLARRDPRRAVGQVYNLGDANP